jgi:hypothetical protein
MPDGVVMFVSGGGEEAMLLLRSPDLVGLGWRLRRANEPRHVFGDQLPADGEVECLAESQMHELQRARARVHLPLGRVRLMHVRGGQYL